MSDRLALRYFDAAMTTNMIGASVADLITATLGTDDWDDWEADDYDGSIEIYGVAPTVTADQLAPLWAAGFLRCWLHAVKRADKKEIGGGRAFIAPALAAAPTGPGDPMTLKEAAERTKDRG